jgi:hypothetical protein
LGGGEILILREKTTTELAQTEIIQNKLEQLLKVISQTKILKLRNR